MPRLADPAAFPGWLRGIVRHHAFRLLRGKRLQVLPLSEAAQMADEGATPDDQLGRKQQAATVLAAIAALPASLREPATLFFLHECSHQDVATFLNLPVATVNNRLHAARRLLKQRTLAMVTQTFQTHGLPDEFANRIGRLIEARGSVVDALFDPSAMPDILAELEVSDEANRCGINVQVVQRRGADIVRGIATSPIGDLPRGSTVLNSGHHARAAVNMAEFRANVYPPVDVLASRSRLLETKAVNGEHLTSSERVRQALALLWAQPGEGKSRDNQLLLERALKVQNYFTQPFFCAEPYTKHSGVMVNTAEAIRTCRQILDGQYDDVPVQAFYFSGDIAEITCNVGRTLTFGPVTR